MDEDSETAYRGAGTTGFQSRAQDYIEELIDLQRILDLRKAGIYPVRVKGQAMQERGICDGDILIANTALRPSHDKVAVAILQALRGLNVVVADSKIPMCQASWVIVIDGPAVCLQALLPPSLLEVKRIKERDGFIPTAHVVWQIAIRQQA